MSLTQDLYDSSSPVWHFLEAMKGTGGDGGGGCDGVAGFATATNFSNIE